MVPPIAEEAVDKAVVKDEPQDKEEVKEAIQIEEK
ncbi:hypothetical protein T06_762 [Trichinella sp. T6]|nr:hypothetical protein T06_762 [Trichinella sp. T6]